MRYIVDLCVRLISFLWMAIAMVTCYARVDRSTTGTMVVLVVL